MIRAYIGLGSNLENPLQQVTDALRELQAIPNSKLVEHSRLYRSDPVGPPGQPDYINAVACLETSLEAEQLLDELQAIEQSHDRVRVQHWGPRTLDMDILLFGDQVINTERLTVPHAFMCERSFVLYPLAEIAPNLHLPNGTDLKQLLSQCPMGTLEPIAL
ncbi:2-amino-4-hydroxy-6-hydroxymethyldihydropteridine pyrophosphokinase [Marinobacterium sp. xm-a-121]|uniref:2-amino-4-hydroxy-6- hydroxymethyldihydropteridine diphosphokinase n=1 Tax=unclassified Marinobacterium TaxID=2644139 RepID=UPI001569F9B8|nr:MULTISPECIES: 2-amino-4-hydroxy-6-hydroxymethyldihydropteridine diphosphokinase [unclassified Marinobacterium]NRP37502.1 2-amino-4-hydroxy-6-hydroxymethyldihydropteridine pyrophosphokinase [Marinobacterium sp. xm-a-121]NRP99846.1 2-amino-4-hydroxy-6-hydroxymethyldihydropteridine pyrophosphokinase [Marinobacterium sp. xm-v-233]